MTLRSSFTQKGNFKDFVRLKEEVNSLEIAIIPIWQKEIYIL